MGDIPEDKTIEELTEEELKRLQGAARMLTMGDNSDLKGAMLIVADQTGIGTYPYVSEEEDPREVSLWMLGAFMAHIADSAQADISPLEVAEHADALLNHHRGDNGEPGGEEL